MQICTWMKDEDQKLENNTFLLKYHFSLMLTRSIERKATFCQHYDQANSYKSAVYWIRENNFWQYDYFFFKNNQQICGNMALVFLSAGSVRNLRHINTLLLR